MPHPTRDTAAARGAADRNRVAISAFYDSTRFDLPEGRDWLVVTNDDPEERPHEYLVTVWVEEGFGRMASCRCEGFNFGHCCRHIRYVQLVDSMLTKAPVREPQPIYYGN